MVTDRRLSNLGQWHFLLGRLAKGDRRLVVRFRIVVAVLQPREDALPAGIGGENELVDQSSDDGSQERAEPVNLQRSREKT